MRPGTRSIASIGYLFSFIYYTVAQSIPLKPSVMSLSILNNKTVSPLSSLQHLNTENSTDNQLFENRLSTSHGRILQGTGLLSVADANSRLLGLQLLRRTQSTPEDSIFTRILRLPTDVIQSILPSGFLGGHFPEISSLQAGPSLFRGAFPLLKGAVLPEVPT